MEWKEAKAPRGEPGPIYNFRRGYSVNRAGRHENSDQYAAFQRYLRLAGNRSLARLAKDTGHSIVSLGRWSERFQWEKRAIVWDKDQIALAWREADQLRKNAHRDSIVEFRNSSERQARLMSRVSEDLVRVLGKRLEKAEMNKEDIPLSMISGLMRAAVSMNEQSREAWGAALGVNELLEVVDTEVEKVRVQELKENEDPYHIEVEE